MMNTYKHPGVVEVVIVLIRPWPDEQQWSRGELARRAVFYIIVIPAMQLNKYHRAEQGSHTVRVTLTLNTAPAMHCSVLLHCCLSDHSLKLLFKTNTEEWKFQ